MNERLKVILKYAALYAATGLFAVAFLMIATSERVWGVM